MSRTRCNAALTLALLALGASAPAVAQAGEATPEYATCVKASPKGTGQYSDKGCTTAAPGGNYRIARAQGIAFSSKLKAVTFSTPELGGTVVCKKGSAKGIISGPGETEEELTLSSCRHETGPKEFLTCQSEGQEAGVVKSNRLHTQLLGEASLVLASDSGPTGYLAQYECGGVLLRTKGYETASIVSPGAHLPSKTQLYTFDNETTLTTEASIDGGKSWGGGPTKVSGEDKMKFNDAKPYHWLRLHGFQTLPPPKVGVVIQDYWDRINFQALGEKRSLGVYLTKGEGPIEITSVEVFTTKGHAFVVTKECLGLLQEEEACEVELEATAPFEVDEAEIAVHFKYGPGFTEEEFVGPVAAKFGPFTF